MSEIHAVALTGLPGSGKSSVGRALAEQLRWSCVDLDDEIASRAGRTIAAIFDELGEPAFRDLELAAMRRALMSEQPVVIACGGGLIAEEQARRELLARAYVVWLDASDAVLSDRLGDGSGRPLLREGPEAALTGLRADRQRWYSLAHLRVDASAPVPVTARRIAVAIGGSVSVPAPGRTYLVAVRPGALLDVSLHVPGGAGRVAVVTDRRVRPAARRLATGIRATGRRVTVMGVAGGERLKTWPAAGRLVRQLSAAGLRRHDCVIALGGGTVGDVTGFAAATYLRGIAWINVPTTLLAMVDSAVGGKTGVNLPRGKNLAGAFWQPRAVVCDPELLMSLSTRAYRAALAEIVKYAMIAEDGLVALLDDRLERLLSRDAEVIAEAVRRSLAIKAHVVAADERDTGLRAILNYGHTVGHALEAATGFGEDLNHGEAIAAGMRVAGKLSVGALGCPAPHIEWQDEVLRRAGLDRIPRVDPSAVMRSMAADKKAQDDGVGWVLLERRGRPRFGQLVPEEAVCTALSQVLA